MDSFMSREELLDVGFKSVGENVLISRKASIYFPEQMTIGSNVRIDDFCFLSRKIDIGNYIHIGVGSIVCGGNEGIKFNDFSAIGQGVSLIADSDNYSGEYLTNPTVDFKYTNCIEKSIILGKHVIIGTGTTVLPGVTFGECSAVGAMSLVVKDTEPFFIYAGSPAKKIKPRSKQLLELEEKFLKEQELLKTEKK